MSLEELTRLLEGVDQLVQSTNGHVSCKSLRMPCTMQLKTLPEADVEKWDAVLSPAKADTQAISVEV